MTALNIHLDDKVRAWLETCAAANGFDTLQSYVEAMLRADAAGGPLVDEEHMEALLLERLNEPFVDADDADLRQMRAKLENRLRGG